MSGTARVFRWLGITLGALVILALGAYGPATLLGPLPAITATALNPTLGGSDFEPPKLPEAGASAVALGSSTELLGSAGVAEAVPMGSIAKVVTALVVLDKHPISEGDSGESVTITKAQVRAYNNYTKQGVRTVQVKAGEIWTEQQLIEAMIMGSSNNHADLLAIWAFGSTKKYLDAANAWLAENGMNDTYVDDATGISAASVGTADDLARLAVLAYDAPAIAAFAGESSVTVGGGRTVYNVSEFMTDSGVTPLALSYTDAAGLTLLYQAEVPVDDTTANLRGVMLWMPDWDTLESSMNSLLKSAEGNITQTTLVSEGDAFGEWTSPWGESAKAVANADVSELVWQSGAPEYLIYLDDPEPSLRGTEVGSVVIETEAGPQEIGLVLDASVSDPGLGWRLTHPFDTIPELIASW